MRAWLETYDLNLPLLDALNDPDIGEVAAQLAALSLGEGLDSGYYDAEDLADMVAALWSEARDRVRYRLSPARIALADLLDRAGPGYQLSLYSVVKQLTPGVAARHLAWLAGLMKTRADMYRMIINAGAAAPAIPTR